MSIAQPTVNAGPMNARVTVTDVDMPFGSMVRFMVKWALASIPAFLMLFFIGLVAAGFVAAASRM
jgi:hypothetical protein